MRFVSAILVFAWLVVAAACAHVPRVDHHQHLLSDAGAGLANRVLPAVELPAELAAVVAARVKSWNDSKALRALYADDAIVFGFEAPGWIRGGEAAANLYGSAFIRPIEMTVVAYRSNDTDATLTGYISRAGEAKLLGYFLLGLQKDASGAWKIVAEAPIIPGPEQEAVVTAADLIGMLDEAGIRRAVIVSDAYYFDAPELTDKRGGAAETRAENDWTAQQAALYPKRLVAFCSVNPLAVYAIEEVDRCAASRRFAGLKMHFRTSGVDLLDRVHGEKVREVVAAANRNRLALLLHVRASGDYGRPHALALLNDILTAAPDVPVQIAHLWGGEGFSEAALTAYAEAVEAGHPAARNLYFDVAQTASLSDADRQKAVALMRRIGLRRILYGSDGPQFGGLPPAEAWQQFRTRMPLTDAELRIIATNVAPYLR